MLKVRGERGQLGTVACGQGSSPDGGREGRGDQRFRGRSWGPGVWLWSKGLVWREGWGQLQRTPGKWPPLPGASPSPCAHPVRGAGPRLLSPLQLAPALPLLSMGGGGGKHPGGRGDPGVSAVTLGTGAEVGAIHHAFPRCLAEIRFHRQLLLLGLCCSRDTEKVLREPLAGAEPPEAPLPPSLPFQGAGPSAGPQQWSPASFPDTRPPRWAPGGVTPAQRGPVTSVGPTCPAPASPGLLPGSRPAPVTIARPGSPAQAVAPSRLDP